MASFVAIVHAPPEASPLYSAIRLNRMAEQPGWTGVSRTGCELTNLLHPRDEHVGVWRARNVELLNEPNSVAAVISIIRASPSLHPVRSFWYDAQLLLPYCEDG
jgi:hypothetical protein